MLALQQGYWEMLRRAYPHWRRAAAAMEAEKLAAEAAMAASEAVASRCFASAAVLAGPLR